MSNSEILEELLWKAHNEGIFTQVWEIAQKIMLENPAIEIIDAVETSLRIILNS